MCLCVWVSAIKYEKGDCFLSETFTSNENSLFCQPTWSDMVHKEAKKYKWQEKYERTTQHRHVLLNTTNKHNILLYNVHLWLITTMGVLFNQPAIPVGK